MTGLAATALESAAHSSAEGPDAPAFLSHVGDVEELDGVTQLDGLFAVDRKLAALCRERGPLRAVLARVAWRLVVLRAWERLGHARLSDYAAERLGLSARWVRSLALVGEAFRYFPRLEEALASGTLGWTKVRLLASLPRGEDEAAWIARARRMTAEQLSKQVRAVDRGSLEVLLAAADDAPDRSRVFEVRCSPDVRWKWYAATSAASREAGRMLHVAEAAELIAAEVLSAIPVDEEWDQQACDEADVSWDRPNEGDGAASETVGTDPAKATGAGADGADAATRPPWHGYAMLASFLDGLEQADAFELDDRLRRALSLEQRLDARMGPLLARVWDRWVHRALGYRTREAYARERLGMDPTRARALVRLERAAVVSEPFARAYRSGSLSWVKAGLLVPLVSADPLGHFMEDWVAWAGQVTVRRLREDVEWALALAETDPEAFRRSGGLPAEARGERRAGSAATDPTAPTGSGSGSGSGREIGAPERDGSEQTASELERENGAPERDGSADTASGLDREIRAPQRDPERDMDAAETCSARFFGPADVVQLFRAVLCTVRRRMERDMGRLPTEGQALGAMLDHVLSCWGVRGGKVAARHRVFDRDGWRCAVPGCTSMQNLHDHHIRFRSAGGSNAPDNRVTLCAFHHLRGVHAERLRCVGRAPGGLTWHMGIRPGAAPLVTYASGDRQLT